MTNETKEIIVNKTKVSYDIVDLSPGRIYKIKLAGFTSLGDGKWSLTAERETFPSGNQISFQDVNIIFR